MRQTVRILAAPVLGVAFAAAAPALAATVSDADAPAARGDYEGPCLRGEQWHGGELTGDDRAHAGIAAFRYCEAEEYTLALYCGADEGKLTLNVEMMVAGADAGETAEATVLVDDRPYEIAGTMRYSTALAGAQPRLEFERDDGLLDALQRGNRALLLVGPEKLDIHLRGSAKAIDAMLSACTD